MAEYQMQASNLPSEDGEKVLFPRIKVSSINSIYPLVSDSRTL